MGGKKDVLMLLEVLGASILTYNETLNTIEGVQVIGPGVKGRILTLQRKQKAKLNKDGKAAGLHQGLNY